VLELSGTFAHLGAQKGHYARYRPVKRVACDECVAFLHTHKGVGPPPRGARVTRRALGGETLRLCTGHGDLWREHDKTVVGL
jgi:hypothetical protein